jgi:hypothetical protein
MSQDGIWGGGERNRLTADDCSERALLFDDDVDDILGGFEWQLSLVRSLGGWLSGDAELSVVGMVVVWLWVVVDSVW